MSRAMSMTLILVAAIALTTVSSSLAAAEILRLSDKQAVSLPELVKSMQSSDLILIGESHTDSSHHDMQLSLIRSLWIKKLPLAIGVEMFQSDSQPHLDAWTQGKISEQDFIRIFSANWSDWPLYRDIFMFAREQHIPMIAMNVPKDIVKKVAHQGFASLTVAEQQGLPQGTSCDINNPHTVFLKRIFQQVLSHMNGTIFTHFCEAQTLRNSGMALNILRYMKKHPGTKVVGLTGIWHAVRNGIPDQLSRNGGSLTSTVILPQIPELSSAFEAADADYLIAL
jgi:uncharacterized iron-regulated protein